MGPRGKWHEENHTPTILMDDLSATSSVDEVESNTCVPSVPVPQPVHPPHPSHFYHPHLHTPYHILPPFVYTPPQQQPQPPPPKPRHPLYPLSFVTTLNDHLLVWEDHLTNKFYECVCQRLHITHDLFSACQHLRVHHEEQPARRYSCKMCDKVFDRPMQLNGHMRTHSSKSTQQQQQQPKE